MEHQKAQPAPVKRLPKKTSQSKLCVKVLVNEVKRCEKKKDEGHKWPQCFVRGIFRNKAYRCPKTLRLCQSLGIFGVQGTAEPAKEVSKQPQHRRSIREEVVILMDLMHEWSPRCQ